MTTAIFILFLITQSGKEVHLDDAKKFNRQVVCEAVGDLYVTTRKELYKGYRCVKQQ